MTSEVTHELEPQPHGGALLRNHALEDLFDPATTIEARQADRLASLPAIYRTAHERLACELALRLDDPEAVFERYRYTPEQAITLLESPAFGALLDRITKEVQTSGLSFRLKAAAISEELLSHAFDLATDPLISAAVRADLIKWSAVVGGHTPKDKDDKGVGSGFNLTIQFANQAPVQVVSHEPVTIDQPR